MSGGEHSPAPPEVDESASGLPSSVRRYYKPFLQFLASNGKIQAEDIQKWEEHGKDHPSGGKIMYTGTDPRAQGTKGIRSILSLRRIYVSDADYEPMVSTLPSDFPPGLGKEKKPDGASPLQTPKKNRRSAPEASTTPKKQRPNSPVQAIDDTDIRHQLNDCLQRITSLEAQNSVTNTHMNQVLLQIQAIYPKIKYDLKLFTNLWDDFRKFLQAEKDAGHTNVSYKMAPFFVPLNPIDFVKNLKKNLDRTGDRAQSVASLKKFLKVCSQDKLLRFRDCFGEDADVFMGHVIHQNQMLTGILEDVSRG
jgi:hypothetical protein